MKIISLLAVVILLCGCAAGYKSEQGRMAFVHWNEGVGRDVEYVEGADAASFQQLKKGEYAKDKNRVYWRGSIITNADPVTFELTVGRYGKDSKHVFLDRDVVEGADPVTFQKLSGQEIWGEDKTDFYYGRDAQHASDPGSFILINGGWAKDRKFYYAYGNFHETRRTDCDYASMKVLNDYWAKDQHRAFYEGKPVERVDLASFHTVGDFDEAKDKYRKYGDPDLERMKREVATPAK